MGRIVAISSGNLLTTRPLNKYAIKLSKKQNPRALFVGTESHDAQEYIHTFTKNNILLLMPSCSLSNHDK